jgi:hypothetical protein
MPAHDRKFPAGPSMSSRSIGPCARESPAQQNLTGEMVDGKDVLDDAIDRVAGETDGKVNASGTPRTTSCANAGPDGGPFCRASPNYYCCTRRSNVHGPCRPRLSCRPDFRNVFQPQRID